MNLTTEGLQQTGEWEKHGYEMPAFDRAKCTKETKENPMWIHFGAGNIFRGFPAACQQKLLDQNLSNKGIIVGEGFDYEIIEKVYAPHDNLSLLVLLKANGQIDKKVVASVVEALKCDPSFEREWNLFKEYFRNPSLQMVTFTITEKGYSLKDGSGVFFPPVVEDLEKGPQQPIMFLSKLTALCYERFLAGAHPVSLVSMDNCSHNGEKLQLAVQTIAEAWEKAGLVENGFCDYLSNPQKVAFPWSMIDKITPRPDAGVTEMLNKDGFEDTHTIVTSKNTFIAPFVNAEELEYLVIEDSFPNGRPALEKAGIFFTDRDTVNNVEKMKVCTCLNPLHTALAIFGSLLGYNLISDEMKDAELKKMIEKIGYEEGMPVVVNPGIIDPKQFIAQVLEERLPNPFMPDTPQRIACDTSQKLAIRFGETIKAYMESKDLDLNDLKIIPLVFAGWCRYLMAIDDNGSPFDLSPDPLLAQVTPHVAGISLGDKGPFSEKLKPLLSDKRIFGVDLYAIGMGPLVEQYFAELIAGPQAIRNTLKKYVG